MKKKIIVACGGAVATSTIAALKIEELCRAHQIQVEICQVRLVEIPVHLENVCLLVTTTKIRQDYGVPYVNGMPFITGIGEKQTEEEILRILTY